MSEYEGTLQEAEQPSPSKWAVEAATELFYGHFDPEDEDDVTQREAMAETIDYAISSALAEQDAVLGEVEGDLVWIKHWAIGYSNSTAAQREEAGAVANAALTKLRSLKR